MPPTPAKTAAETPVKAEKKEKKNGAEKTRTAQAAARTHESKVTLCSGFT